MDEAQIEEFEKVEVQLQGLHEEIGLLSKKRPDGVVNKWKLKYVDGERSNLLTSGARKLKK